MTTNVKPIDLSAIKALLATERTKDVRAGISLVCAECNSRLDNGYCRNKSCPTDNPLPTYDCEVCGHCNTPNHCVASVECPRCSVGVGSLCKDDRGGLTGYHEDRWKLVLTEYGTYYR